MNAMKGKILSLIVAVAMIAGGAQACQINNRPTRSSTPSVTTESSIPATTPNQEETTAETTTDSAPVETTAETTAPIETTAAPTETTAPVETTQATAAPTKAPSETTTAPSETPLIKTVYATGNVNIRSGPGTNYDKVRSVTAGTPLNVVALTANNWYRLDDSTYVSPSVVSDIMPTPTPTPTPSPTPDPNATPTPTPGANLTAAEATALVKSIVTSIRSANGLTTNFSSVLDTRCYKSAARFVIDHSIPNGSYESCGAIGQLGDRVTWTSGPDYYSSLDEGLRDLARYLVVTHVPDMATNGEQTEFGVGVAKETFTHPVAGELNAYYVYISCASPHALAVQIDDGWYD
jgi:hypothetical protein